MKIRTGFHRLGLLAASPLALFGAAMILFGAPGYASSGLGWMLGALGVYCFAWAVGWVIAGFAGQ